MAYAVNPEMYSRGLMLGSIAMSGVACLLSAYRRGCRVISSVSMEESVQPRQLLKHDRVGQLSNCQAFIAGSLHGTNICVMEIISFSWSGPQFVAVSSLRTALH
jgi:hypothetical protein